MRKLGLVTVIGLASLGLSGQSIALGLGEIEVKSFLNQPLQAEIEVISARPGEIDDLLVTLASRDAFSRAGLTRPQFLSNLRFEIQKSEEGDSATVLVTTQQAVKEPFLNFLIEADWSKGRVLREFTVLLDPPFYADQPDPADQQTGTTQAQVESVAGQATGSIVDEVVVEDTTAATPQPQPIAIVEEETSSTEEASTPIATMESDDSSMEAATPTPTPSASGITSFVVEKGDTLWGIASQVQGGDQSMNQVMLAFQRMNPDAFGDGNINNLKVGAVLRVPDIDEIEAISQQQAYAQVLEQNGLWDEYVARVTGVAPSVAADGAAAEGEPAAQDGELSLLMPTDGESGAVDSGQIDELRTRLALSEEELDSARIENAELESRITELQARLAKLEELQAMVEIEDDSLAQIQADQQESTEAVEEPVVEEAPAMEPVLADEMSASEEELLEELLAEEAEAQQAEDAIAAADEAVTEEAPVSSEETMAADDSIAEEDSMVEDAAPADDTMASDDAMVDDEVTEAAEPPPAPVIVTAPSQPTSMLDELLPPAIAALIPAVLLGNPMILGGIGGLILLLLLLILVKRRKGKGDDESSILEDDAEGLVEDDEEELTPIHLAEPQDDPDPLMDTSQTEAVPDGTEQIEAIQEEAEEEDELARTAIIKPGGMPEPEAPAAAAGEQDDVLNEADVYLAYGLYDNAVDLLSSNLDESPDRADYRAKLLDTHFATKNTDAFVKEADILKSMGAAANPYWDRVQVMGYELAPDNALFSDAKDSGLSAADLAIAKPKEADFDLGAGEEESDDTNFSITDFNLAEETGGKFDDSAEQSADSNEELLDLDNLPNLDDEVAEAQAEANIDEDGLDFALPDDLDLGAESESAEADAGAAVDLDLDADVSEVNLDLDDEDIEVDLDDVAGGESEVPEFEPTAIIDTTPGYEETAIVRKTGSGDDLIDDDISRLDLGTEDTSEVAEVGDEDDVVLDVEGMDDDLDISLGDFSEPEGDEDARTGTFAPGDFDEPEGSADSAEDIEDMMLPDDVDEVSTKLDLARAFIDMGDVEGAKGSLKEVLAEGNDEQKAEAQSLLDQL